MIVAPQSPAKAEVQKVFKKMFSSVRERSGMRRMRVYVSSVLLKLLNFVWFWYVYVAHRISHF